MYSTIRGRYSIVQLVRGIVRIILSETDVQCTMVCIIV